MNPSSAPPQPLFFPTATPTSLYKHSTPKTNLYRAAKPLQGTPMPTHIFTLHDTLWALCTP